MEQTNHLVLNKFLLSVIIKYSRANRMEAKAEGIQKKKEKKGRRDD